MILAGDFVELWRYNDGKLSLNPWFVLLLVLFALAVIDRVARP